MQIVIDIKEEDYRFIHEYKFVPEVCILSLGRAIKNGTPLPKGHGAIKDVSQIEIPMCEDRTYERWVQVAIDSAPTIIEADKEQENGTNK